MQCPSCGAKVMDDAAICPVCGSAVGQQTLPIGTVLLGKYRLDGLLGQGGFGITYAATQAQIDLHLAVKELFPEGTLRIGTALQPPLSLGLQGWREAKRSFIDEARLLARFSDPGIVRVVDFFEANSTSYMVMERLEGESLQDRLDRAGKLSAPVVQEIALHVSQALDVVHAAGLLHRDIKPSNIFLEKSGRVVLIDFGSAREFIGGKTVSYTRLISQGYAPLEQYGSSGRFGPYSDIYGLGATLYHALTGNAPPSATDLIQGVPLLELPFGTPLNLVQFVEKAMNVRVDDRPQNMRDGMEILVKPPLTPLGYPSNLNTPLTQHAAKQVLLPTLAPQSHPLITKHRLRYFPWLIFVVVLMFALVFSKQQRVIAVANRSGESTTSTTYNLPDAHIPNQDLAATKSVTDADLPRFVLVPTRQELDAACNFGTRAKVPAEGMIFRLPGSYDKEVIYELVPSQVMAFADCSSAARFPESVRYKSYYTYITLTRYVRKPEPITQWSAYMWLLNEDGNQPITNIFPDEHFINNNTGEWDKTCLYDDCNYYMKTETFKFDVLRFTEEQKKVISSSRKLVINIYDGKNKIGSNVNIGNAPMLNLLTINK